MKLNLDFYKGTDEYSDGDIEDTILKFIKKYPDNLEKAFLENEEWAIFYHLSSLEKILLVGILLNPTALF